MTGSLLIAHIEQGPNHLLSQREYLKGKIQRRFMALSFYIIKKTNV